MRILLISVALTLGACQSVPPKPNPPAPDIIEVSVATYVPIDAAMTKRCSWVRADRPSAVFEVSNGRKRCLDQYEAQFDSINQVQGKPVPHQVPQP